MRRWRLGKRKLPQSKSLVNVNQVDGQTSWVESTLRTAASTTNVASDVTLEVNLFSDDFTHPCGTNDVSRSTDLAPDDGTLSVTNESFEQSDEVKDERAYMSDMGEQTVSSYKQVYRRDYPYRSRSLLPKPDSQLLSQYSHAWPHAASRSTVSQSTERVDLKETLEQNSSNNSDNSGVPKPSVSRRVSEINSRPSNPSSRSGSSSSSNSPRSSTYKLPSTSGHKIDVTSTREDVPGSSYLSTEAPSMSGPVTIDSRGEAHNERNDESSNAEEHQHDFLARDSLVAAPGNEEKKDAFSKKATKKMLRLFIALPHTEKALDYYSCALQSDILLHGTLFISTHYIAFYSKIFYHVSRVLFPISEVKRISKERTAKFIPNGIGIYLHDGRSFLFGSLLSRDATYNLLMQVASQGGSLAVGEAEAPIAHNNSEDESASVSDEQSETTEQEGASARTSSSTSSPPTLHAHNRRSIISQSSTTSTDPPKNTKLKSVPEQGDEVDGVRVAVENKSAKISLYGAQKDESSSEESRSNSNQQDKSNEKKCRRFPINKQSHQETSKFMKLVMKVIGFLATPQSTAFNVILVVVLALLFASAGMLLYRIERLSQDLVSPSIRTGMKNGEYLELQQRLQFSTATGLKRALSAQLQHLTMVRQSLHELARLFKLDQAG